MFLSSVGRILLYLKAVVPLNIKMLNAIFEWLVDRFVTPMHYISRNINAHTHTFT